MDREKETSRSLRAGDRSSDGRTRSGRRALPLLGVLLAAAAVAGAREVRADLAVGVVDNAGTITLALVDASDEVNDINISIGGGGGVRIEDTNGIVIGATAVNPTSSGATFAEWAANAIDVIAVVADGQNDTIDVFDTASGVQTLVIQAEAGNDTIRIFDTHATSATLVEGGDGSDTITITTAHGPTLSVSGGTSGDFIDVNDTFTTTATVVNGDDGNDDIDVFNAHGAQIVLSGDDGADNIDVRETFATTTVVSGDSTSVPAAQGADTLLVREAHGGSCTVLGGPSGDGITVTTTHTNTVVSGEAGADTITINNAQGSTLTVSGGAGGDTINLNQTNTTTSTTVVGDADVDQINVSNANGPMVTVLGGDQGDFIDVFSGGATQLFIFGDNDPDTAAAGVGGADGIDVRDSTAGTLSVFGGPQGDVIRIRDTHTTTATVVCGDGGNDVITTDDAHGPQLTILGDDGNDDLNLLTTHTTTGTAVSGGTGVDDIDVTSAAGAQLVVQGGDDGDAIDVQDTLATLTIVFGDTDPGSIAADPERDGAAAAAGADQIAITNAHGDTLVVNGGPFNDTIALADTSTAVSTTLSGDAGTDTITVSDAHGAALAVLGGEGPDDLNLLATHTTTSTVVNGGGSGDDIDVTSANGPLLIVQGGDGADDILVTSTAATGTTVNGDTDAATAGQGGALGGPGGDVIVVTDATGGTLAINGGPLNDLIQLTDTHTTVSTTISGNGGADGIAVTDAHGPQLAVFGNDGVDLINVITTHAGTTVVFGDTGADSIAGSSGGAGGAATLVGGDTINILDAFGNVLIVQGGPLDDAITLTETHTATATQIFGNGGPDTITVLDATTPQLIVSGGDDGDLIGVADTNTTTSTTILGDAGADTINIVDAHGPSLVVNGGDDDDAVNITDVGTGTALGDITVVGGGGNDIVTLTGTTAITGTLVFDVETTQVTGTGVLEATGSVTGQLLVAPGGTVAPGSGTRLGSLSSGNVVLNAGSNLSLQIEGTTPVTNHDVLIVTGTVDLGGSNLVLAGTYVPQPNDPFLLVINDGADPVVGTFTGLPEGAQVVVNGVVCYITYVGGDGNDVLLIGPAQISISDATVTEGNTGDTPILGFIISRSHNVGDISVDWATADDTATSFGIPPDLDFIADAQTANFPTGGAFALPVLITVVGDDIVELTEFMFVNLSNPMPAAGIDIVDPQALGTIENDDRGFIEINDVAMAEGDLGATIFTFIATLSHAVDVPVTVDYATLFGTATVSDDDYLYTTGSVTFAAVTPGETELINTVVNGDTKVEPDETFFLVLSNIQAQGRNITFSDDTGLGTIINDDEVGACCLPENGSCHITDGIDCAAAGGIFQGEGSNCAVVCPQPATGACCAFDGSCSSVSLNECVSGGGVYQGDGVACGAVACALPGDSRTGVTTEKGSFFVFPSIELRWDGAAPHPLREDTFLSLTNDATQDVQVQMYFINGDPPLDAVRDPNTGAIIERAHPGWNSLDNLITLTANQPVYWSVLTGQPAGGGLSSFTALDPGTPPGRPAMDGTTDRVLRGYIVGWAVNDDGDEIRWNHLAGNGTILNYADGYAWEYGSVNHAVVANVPNGSVPDGTPGRIGLDGNEYALGPDALVLNFQGAMSVAWGVGAPRALVTDTDLTIHPLSVDLRQNNTGPVTTKASFTVWNTNEVKLSGTHRCITCWDRQLISLYELPNHLLRANLQTDHGKARIDGVRSVNCDAPLGVFSREAAITAVAARLLYFDAGAANQDIGAAAVNVVGAGVQPALVRYDAPGGSQEAGAPKSPAELPMNPTTEEIDRFLETFLRSHGR